MARRLTSGSGIDVRDFTSVKSVKVRVPDPDRLVHLQFRRFAGCPICHTHLRSFARRQEEVQAAGIREVVFFHTGADELWEHTDALPFDVIADPDKRVYRQFGVEAGRSSLLRPGAWWGMVRGAVPTTVGILRKRILPPPSKPEGGRLGLPADFLIEPSGRVLAAKYGEHANDQWTVDTLLKLAATAETSKR
ncbi:MAG: peroxiredoxin-like family protein [Stackebrandtia sp.]